MRKLLSLCLAAAFASPTLAAPADWQARARDLLARTVEIPSVAGKTGAAPVASLLAAEFRAAGFAEQDVRVLPYRDTAALMVKLRASEPKRGALLLIGHMDVVDALASDWTRDPFRLIEEDGYFYGRGVLDMKGAIVAQAIALMRLKAEGATLDRDVVLFLTGDEESTGEGSLRMVGEWRSLHDGVLALNGDAGGGAVDRSGRLLGFRLQTAEKTYASYTITVRNRGGHSSKPRPDNAIYGLAGVLERLAAHRFAPLQNETTKAYFEAMAPLQTGALGQAMRRFARNPADGKAADRIEAEEAEVGMTRTTCVATLLNAGHAENALPQTAMATVNCRIFPGVTPEAVRDELARVAGQDADVAILNAFGRGTTPPSPLTAEIVDAYKATVQARHPGATIIPEMTPGATDGGVLREAGIPTYGADGQWMVVPDDLRAHGRDERLRIDAFFANLDHWRDLVMALAKPAAQDPQAAR